MVRDIFIRDPKDPNFQFIYEHSSPIESIIAKIKMILGTRQGDVLGDLSFGVGIEDYVFETKINSRELEEKIKSQISLYISEAADYTVTPKVSFGKEIGYDYCIIDIYINGVKTAGILIK
jgi:hypothetical protein